MLTDYTNELRTRFEKEIGKIKRETPDIKSQCLSAIPVIRQILLELKIYIQAYDFSDTEEEINFNKNIAPAFNSEYIYHVKALNIETRMPDNEPESRKIYLQEHINWINRFFDQNKSLYQYYKVEATAFDDKFFLRGPEQAELEREEVCAIMDNNFCTLYSYKFAQFKGYEKLLDHFASCFLRTKENRNPGLKTPITWTGKKVFLVELLYMLFYSKCFNNGNVSLRELATWLEFALNTKIDNFYRIKQEIINRHNMTAFIDFCREAYTNGMTESL